MTDDLKLVERLRDPQFAYYRSNINSLMQQSADAIERLVRERDAAKGTADDVYRKLMPRAEAAEADRDRLAGLVAEMREVMSDATEALATKLEAEDRATKLRPPYEHPLSALDRARALLQRTQEQS